MHASLRHNGGSGGKLQWMSAHNNRQVTQRFSPQNSETGTRVATQIRRSQQSDVNMSSVKYNCCGQICGDSKVILNPYLEVYRHPLPRIENFFTELQKGELYSKTDLSQAHTQLY